MKPLTATLTLVFAALLSASTVLAQDGQEMRTRFMMLNQHQCPSENMEPVMEMMETIFAPVFRDMEAAGEIDDWGVLTHAWGDEWNFNFYIVTEDQRAFLDAWDSMGRRATEREPDWYATFSALCGLHKDNMYTLYDSE